MLKHNEGWLARNVVGDGEAISGKLLADFGADPEVEYFIALRIICMGDLNAVDLAQGIHEQVLKDCGCMNPDDVIQYGHPTPESDTWEGLYIDDHIVSQVVCRQRFPRVRRAAHKLRDEQLLEASRLHYASVGLPRSEGKAFEKLYTFTA